MDLAAGPRTPDLSHAAPGESFLYCPRCPFQLRPGEATAPTCPDCGAGLRVWQREAADPRLASGRALVAAVDGLVEGLVEKLASQTGITGLSVTARVASVAAGPQPSRVVYATTLHNGTAVVVWHTEDGVIPASDDEPEPYWWKPHRPSRFAGPFVGVATSRHGLDWSAGHGSVEAAARAVGVQSALNDRRQRERS